MKDIPNYRSYYGRGVTLTDEEQIRIWRSTMPVGTCWVWQGTDDIDEIRRKLLMHVRQNGRINVVKLKYYKCHEGCVNWLHLTSNSYKDQKDMSDPPESPDLPAVRRMKWREK